MMHYFPVLINNKWWITLKAHPYFFNNLLPLCVYIHSWAIWPLRDISFWRCVLLTAKFLVSLFFKWCILIKRERVLFYYFTSASVIFLWQDELLCVAQTCRITSFFFVGYGELYLFWQEQILDQGQIIRNLCVNETTSFPEGSSDEDRFSKVG